MTELGRVFKPEIAAHHKINFSVAQIMTLTAGQITAAIAGDGRIKAGTIVKTLSATLGATIINEPLAGCEVAATTEAQGILAHDIHITDASKTDYAAGVIISGVVYEDVVAAANGLATAEADVTALALQGILFYNVKTLKG